VLEETQQQDGLIEQVRYSPSQKDGLSTGSRISIDIKPSILRSGSGKHTLSVFRPVVSPGEVVQKNQIIAEGACVSYGSISTGRNLLTAIMPYKGYNFEDAIVISSSVAEQQKLISYHSLVVEEEIEPDDRVVYIVPEGTDTKKGEPLLKKVPGNLESIFQVSEEELEEMESGLYIKKSPGGVIIQIDCFSNNPPPILHGLSQETRKRYNLSPSQILTNKGEKLEKTLLKFYLRFQLNITTGDKLANRHGNKGTIALVEDKDSMPITPWGERVELILNPLGIVNRMNVGQLYELYVGLLSKWMARKILSSPSKQDVQRIVALILPLLDKTPNQRYSNSVIRFIQTSSPSQFKELLEQTKKFEFFPILIPPFKAPTYKEILLALKAAGLQTKYHLVLPSYDNQKTYYPVPVGYMYINKLEHIAEFKVHARSTGLYTSKTRQPVAGKSRGGGQRVGEAETYVLIGYNCLALLSEFFGPIADDVVSKNEIISNIIQTGHSSFVEAKTNTPKELLKAYLTSIMLTG
jgi:DNA-directed RNA polymerase subunit beta